MVQGRSLGITHIHHLAGRGAMSSRLANDRRSIPAKLATIYLWFSMTEIFLFYPWPSSGVLAPS